MSTREKVASFLEDALFLDPPEFDDAIIGIATRADGVEVVAYDRTRCIDILAALSSGLSRTEAEEFFEFNTAGAWVGHMTPIFVDTRWAE